MCLVTDGVTGNDTNEWGECGRMNGWLATFALSTYTRHRNGVSIVYVDGHAEWRSGAWLQELFNRENKYGSFINPY